MFTIGKISFELQGKTNASRGQARRREKESEREKGN